MKFGDYPKAGSLDGVTGFRNYVRSLGLDMPCDDIVAHGPQSPLGSPLEFDGMTIGHRLAIQPMEGWDCERDGRPSDNTKRRWRRFGLSGAKLLWGGEACAVRPDGRANPKQLIMTEQSQRDIAEMRESVIAAHKEATGEDGDDVIIGLQLTHSGRFCKPNDNTKFESIIAYRHPLLDRKFGYPDNRPVISDDEIKRLVEDFVLAAKRAQACGFDFVDIKHCHGYLAHEFLSAVDRKGPYGGSLENRTRFLREVVEGIRAEAPGLRMGVRLSAIELGAVQARPRAFDTGRARPRCSGRVRFALPLCLRRQPAGPAGIRLDRAEGVPGNSARPRHPLRQHHRRQPLLQSAHHPPGALSALRRLPPAGRPVRRRHAAAFGGARSEGGIPRLLLHGLQATLICRNSSPTSRRRSPAAAGWT